MNDLAAKIVPPPAADAGGATAPVVASPPKPGPAPAPAPGTVRPQPGPHVVIPIGSPGYKFTHAVDSEEGQRERREHERVRKSNLRAAAPKPASDPPPLPPANGLDQGATPLPGQSPEPPAAPAEIFVPWTAADVAEFTDELVELTEAKRVTEFVVLAKEAKLPPKFIVELEKDAGYGVKTKASLKRSIGNLAAKWLNKTGVSAKNKEEAALLFCIITVKMQGVRLRKDLNAEIADHREREAKAAEPKPAQKPDPRLV